jgi:hypothetical protein
VSASPPLITGMGGWPGGTRRARVRGRSSGVKPAAHRLRRRPGRPGLSAGDLCGPWRQEERAGQGACPAGRAARGPVLAGAGEKWTGVR